MCCKGEGISPQYLACHFYVPGAHYTSADSLQAVVGKVFVSLLSPTAFTFAADLIGEYEGGGQGLRWGDLWADPYPLGAVLIMLALDAKLYAFLAWCALLEAHPFLCRFLPWMLHAHCTISFGMPTDIVGVRCCQSQ